MDRIKNYTIVFLISLVLFVAFHFNGLIDPLIFIAFVLSSLILIFTKGELPKKKEDLDVPEIHYYHRSKNSSYHYFLSGAFILLSVAYSILTMYLNIRQGFVVLLLWAIAIICTFLITNIFGEKTYLDSINDYIFKGKNISPQEAYNLEKIISELEKKNVKQNDTVSLEEIFNKYKLSEKIKTETIRDYFEYKNAIASPLSSSEISAYNEKHSR